MEGYREILMDKNAIKCYQKDIISVGLCTLFFKANYLRKDGKILEISGVRGYTPFMACPTLSASEMIDILIDVLKQMIEGEQHCIFIGEYKVSKELLYLREVDMKAKLLYYPYRYSSKDDLTRDLADILEFGKTLTEGDARGYLDKAASIVTRNKSSFEIICRRLLGLKKEAYMCGY